MDGTVQTGLSAAVVFCLAVAVGVLAKTYTALERMRDLQNAAEAAVGSLSTAVHSLRGAVADLRTEIHELKVERMDHTRSVRGRNGHAPGHAPTS